MSKETEASRGAVAAPVEPTVRPLVAALRAYQQADADGVMVLVSRQACEEAAAEIERLDAWAVAYYRETRTALLKERESIARWLEGQGQPGYAHEVRYGAGA